jgi:uncharacterized protein YcbK (DUF882 family)
MQITENFNLNEFNSKCGRPMPANVRANIIELAKNLQVLRDEVKAPITITSGYRSPERNAKIKGAKNSQHVQGTAVDLKVQGLTPKEVAPIIEKLIKDGKMKQGGIGVYSNWIHYDIRGTKARW